MTLNKAYECWKEWELAIGRVVTDRFQLAVYTTDSHPCSEYINSQKVPRNMNNQPTFILHALPESGNQGYVDDDILQNMIDAIDTKSWVMLFGTSG